MLSIDGHPLNNTIEFREMLRKGGARPRTLIVEREGGVSATVVVTPQVTTTVNPVGIIAYGEEGKRRSLIVVPVTRDLLDRDPAAPRDQLMVLGISPEDPALAETLRIGTIIDKIDAREKIVSVRTLEAFAEAVGPKPREVTLYWKRANGDAGNLTLRDACSVAKQPV